MHIADIDYARFYGETLGAESRAAEFVECIRRIPRNVSLAKIVAHQAARLVWLADRMEECARGRPALQILFFVIAAEAVAKLVNGFEDDGESRRHVRLFFEEICSDRARERLSRAFSSDQAAGFVAVREAVDFLYRIRCDVAHRGQYFTYTLMERGMPMLSPLGEGFLIAHIGASELREIVLEGALLGALRLIPGRSECRDLLRL